MVQTDRAKGRNPVRTPPRPSASQSSQAPRNSSPQQDQRKNSIKNHGHKTSAFKPTPLQAPANKAAVPASWFSGNNFYQKLAYFYEEKPRFTKIINSDTYLIQKDRWEYEDNYLMNPHYRASYPVEECNKQSSARYKGWAGPVLLYAEQLHKALTGEDIARKIYSKCMQDQSAYINDRFKSMLEERGWTEVQSNEEYRKAQQEKGII